MPRRSTVLRAVTFAATAALIAGCQNRKAPPPALPPAKVVVEVPRTEPVTEYGEYTGYLEAVQRVEIRPQVRGRLLKVHVKEGTEIEKGTLLYEIDPQEYLTAKQKAVASRDRAVADQGRATAELEKARADLARATNLRKSNAISEEQYLQFEVAEKTAVAAVAQAAAAIKQGESDIAAAELNLSYTKIYAPISGRISRTLVTEGNLVGYNPEQTHLTIMVDVDPIYVFFDVPEREVIDYEGWARANNRPLWSSGKIPLEVGIETEPGFPHKGIINFREPRFEPGTGTLRLRGVLDNTTRKLSSGMFARVRFPKGDPVDRLTVPGDAVLSGGQEGRYVFVAAPPPPPKPGDPPPPDAPEGFETVFIQKRPVDVGPQVGGRVVVGPADPGQENPDRGLKPGDRVIVRGVQKVRPGGYALVEKRPAGGAPAAPK